LVVLPGSRICGLLFFKIFLYVAFGKQQNDLRVELHKSKWWHYISWRMFV